MPGIYVHIPFCKSKCSYCDFTSFPDKLYFAESYMACVFREMSKRSKELESCKFDTLYIGGGTPSIIDDKYIGMLIVSAKRNFNLAKDAEITIEINPCTLTQEKVKNYKKYGINRFSVGLQSANDKLLADIGRTHTVKDFVFCANLLNGENFNADIMIGLKGQTLKDVDEAITLANDCGASHISMYALTPADGTPIYTDYLNGELPDSDEVASMYEEGYNKLKELAFNRYEVSNFCKPGKESKHNLNYWNRGEYIGFGVSASSHIGGVRFTNTFDLDEYFKCLLSDNFAVVNSEKIEGDDAEEEYIMLRLRTSEGLNAETFYKLFKTNFFEKYAPQLKKLKNYLNISENIKIKEEYLFVQNTIIVEFFK